MQIPQLTNYILEELERGTPEIEIKQKLFRSKWLPEEIEENYEYALAQAQQMLQQFQLQRPRQSSRKKYTLFAVALLSLSALLMLGAGFFLLNQPTPPLSEQQLFSPAPTSTGAPASPNSAASPEPQPSLQRALFNENDRRRELDRIQIQSLLRTYYERNQIYPQTLSQLATLPESPSIPTDVRTGNPYRYEVLEGEQDYKLCIVYEESDELCFNRLSQ
ncbi:MAG: hypothetical protein KatS3mg087_0305 [Patescibacteria group bacterium]|nr:MAG: hypothetical protein KatS3mg087_0305 [Patescibacteria group bacterium]